MISLELLPQSYTHEHSCSTEIVGAVLKDIAMEQPILFYEVELRRYTVLYFLLGVVEHELRKRIPIALSDYAYISGELDWWETLPQTRQNINYIARAIRKNGNSPFGFEHHLPFGFWRYIFVGEHYSTLWLESLHLIFPQLKNPLEKRTYEQICNRIYRAYTVRNKVAHYEFMALKKYENEKAYLIWLIKVMGGPSN